MEKVLGIFDVDAGLVATLRRAMRSESGIEQIDLYESAGLEKWDRIAMHTKSDIWDLDAEMLAHALTLRAICRLPASYQMVSYFRVVISGAMHKAHALTLILDEDEFRQVRESMKQIDPNEYSNICLDLLVANRIVERQKLAPERLAQGESLEEIFVCGQGTRLKIAALDRMQRFSKRTYEDFLAPDPGVAKGVYQISRSGVVFYLSGRPPTAETGDAYIDLATSDYWVWDGKGWVTLGGSSGAEPSAPPTIKINNTSDKYMAIAGVLSSDGAANIMAKSMGLTWADVRAYQEGVRAAKSPTETGEVRGEDNGLTERIDVKGGPLPTLPKVEICPECKNTGQVLNFMQYHPCPRGCKTP